MARACLATSRMVAWPRVTQRAPAAPQAVADAEALFASTERGGGAAAGARHMRDSVTLGLSGAPPLFFSSSSSSSSSSSCSLLLF